MRFPTIYPQHVELANKNVGDLKRLGLAPTVACAFEKRQAILINLLLLFSLAPPFSAQQQNSQPRVFLQSASKGNTWNASRDQSMEMAKDFQKDCPSVRITIAQEAADYTVLLNHIEVGLVLRDNQVQVADRNGDMLILHEGTGIKSGSIRGSVRIACRMITEDWSDKNRSATFRPTDPPTAEAATPIAPETTSEVPPQRVNPPPAPKAANDAAANPIPVALSKTPSVTSPASPPAVPATPAVPMAPFVVTNANEGSLGAFSDAKPSVRHDGVVLSRVAAGGPSDVAGLMEGDVVLAIGDHYIYTVDEMNAELRRHKVGEHLSIRYRRFPFTSVAVVTLGPVQ